MTATVSGTGDAADHVGIDIEAIPPDGFEGVSVGSFGRCMDRGHECNTLTDTETTIQTTVNFEPPAAWAGSSFVIEITVSARWSQSPVIRYSYQWQPQT
jgi:hypothetical protein